MKKIDMKKYQMAQKLMMRDYIRISNTSNMFLVMTKAEEVAWENKTIQEYYDNYTKAQLEAKLNEDGGFTKTGEALLKLGFLAQ